MLAVGNQMTFHLMLLLYTRRHWRCSMTVLTLRKKFRRTVLSRTNFKILWYFRDRIHYSVCQDWVVQTLLTWFCFQFRFLYTAFSGQFAKLSWSCCAFVFFFYFFIYFELQNYCFENEICLTSVCFYIIWRSSL